MRNLFLINTLLFFISLGSYAAEVGKVTHLSGVLTVNRINGDNKILSINSPIMDGDNLRTEEDTYARLKFNDNAEIVLRPETNFKVNQHTFNTEKPENNKSDMELIKGGMRAVTGLIGKTIQMPLKLARLQRPSVSAELTLACCSVRTIVATSRHHQDNRP